MAIHCNCASSSSGTAMSKFCSSNGRSTSSTVSLPLLRKLRVAVRSPDNLRSSRNPHSGSIQLEKKYEPGAIKIG
jgi:hypothetical protein